MSSSFVAVRALRNAINNGNSPWRSYATTSKVNKKQAGKQSVTSSESQQQQNIDPPQNIFKKGETKDLGPGASKQGNYKNPEYFSYHNMSYAEMDVVMAKLRVPQPSAKAGK